MDRWDFENVLALEEEEENLYSSVVHEIENDFSVDNRSDYFSKRTRAKTKINRKEER